MRGVRCSGPRVGVSHTPSPGTTKNQSFASPGIRSEVGFDEPPTFPSRKFVGHCIDETDHVTVWFSDALRPDAARAHPVRVLRGRPRPQDTVLA